MKWGHSLQYDMQKKIFEWIWKALLCGGIIYSGTQISNRICKKKLEEIKEALKKENY